MSWCYMYNYVYTYTIIYIFIILLRYMCVCVPFPVGGSVLKLHDSCRVSGLFFSVLRLNEFFKLRISTNLLISQFLEMADDASQGRHLAAYGGLMQHVFSPFGS